MIAKEQTAQAIANTARAYERSGVEAALREVSVPGRRVQQAWALSSCGQFSHISLILCLI